jgi:hypothetical protein
MHASSITRVYVYTKRAKRKLFLFKCLRTIRWQTAEDKLLKLLHILRKLSDENQSNSSISKRTVNRKIATMRGIYVRNNINYVVGGLFKSFSPFNMCRDFY